MGELEHKIAKFNEYLSEVEEKSEYVIYLLKKSFDNALIISDSVNNVRDFVNTPPEDFYPQTFADKSLDISSKTDIEVVVYNQEFLEKENPKLSSSLLI